MSSSKKNAPKSADSAYPLIRRCMAIVLGEQDEENRPPTRLGSSCASLGLDLCHGMSEGPGPPHEGKCPGPHAFREFVRENSECFWNPCLVQSVRDLEYRGCIAPCTTLVSGTEYSLEVVRSAWARRMLRAPSGYHILALGDLEPVKMSVVAQTQFAPLPEALCKVVYDLNREGSVANMAVIERRLKANFPEINLPEEDVLYRALGALIRERKLFHTGQGYSVVTPDTFRLLAMSPPLERQILLTNEEAIVRLHGAAATEGRTACTQTNQKNSALSSWSSAERILLPSLPSQQGRLKRCHSLKLLQKGRDKEKIFRTNSFRSSKASPARESKSDAEINSIKKEKPSVFSKWFRRGRDKKSAPKSSTFSSQFPPRDRSDPDFVHFNSRATQTLGSNERLPPKPPKSRSSSLSRMAGKERPSQCFSSTPITPKVVQRNGHYQPLPDLHHSRSSSLPRKSSPSPKRENSRFGDYNSRHPASARKTSPKPPSRQRQHQGNLHSRVPTGANCRNSCYASTFSPIVTSDDMLVRADDKYIEVSPVRRQPISAWAPQPNLGVKPSPAVPLSTVSAPWRTVPSSTTTAESKIGISEPIKTVPIGLPQRIVAREVASVPPSMTTTVAKPQAIKTVSENAMKTETNTTSPKQGLHIDGSVDVEISLGKILSNSNKPGLLSTDLDDPTQNDLLKIAASWNQSMTNNTKLNASGNKSNPNQTMSATASIKTSITHGGLNDSKSRVHDVNVSNSSENPMKVIKSTTIVDCVGKCTLVGEPTNNGVSSRSKIAEAKRDFFADSPSPTEPVSLKDDSGFSSSTSTSRPMSVSPC